MAAQETRALLTARKLVPSKLYDIEMSLRGILRGFGLKVGPTTPKRFAQRIEELVAGHATLELIAKALLVAHASLLREFDMFEKCVRAMARADKRARLIMSTPGVGAIVALTYVSAIDDPSRFSSSKRVGAHFGMTPKKYPSGEKDVTGRIGAHVLLQMAAIRCRKTSRLKLQTRFAMPIFTLARAIPMVLMNSPIRPFSYGRRLIDSRTWDSREGAKRLGEVIPQLSGAASRLFRSRGKLPTPLGSGTASVAFIPAPRAARHCGVAGPPSRRSGGGCALLV